MYGRSSFSMRLSKAEELHVVGTPNGDGVTDTSSVDTLDIGTVDGPCVSALGVVGLGALGLVVVVAENTSLTNIIST